MVVRQLFRVRKETIQSTFFELGWHLPRGNFGNRVEIVLFAAFSRIFFPGAGPLTFRIPTKAAYLSRWLQLIGLFPEGLLGLVVVIIGSPVRGLEF